MQRRDISIGLEAPALGPAEADEAKREAVATMLEREQRSITSSLLALSLLAAAIAFLPEPELMFAFLFLRLLSFVMSRQTARKLETSVRERLPMLWPQRLFCGAMVCTGITLGLLLWPHPSEAPTAAVAMIRATVIVTVTLIAVTFAALPRARDAMLASFWLTVATVILLHPADLPAELLLVLAMAVIGVRMYSASAGRHIENSAAMLVENRRLSEDLATALAHAEFLSWCDPLTGLLNRRRLFEEPDSQDLRSKACHVLTIDLDRFKAINDRLGHAAGDHVLIAAADTIRELIAELPHGPHRAFRLGGEEFLIILSGLDRGRAYAAAEALRTRIARIGGKLERYKGIAVTASIGLAEWRVDEPLDEVLLRSDLACYEAKGHGRDRVCAAA